jgi:putative membrane protein
MVVFDLVMEPVAIGLNMWTWQVGLPPAQNYLAWFIISFAFMSLFPLFRLKPRNTLAAHLFVYMFIFFGLLNLILS